MALIVYGGSISPFVRKVRDLLAEKGVEYTLEAVNPFSPPPDFLAISPLKRIPVLRDTDRPEPNTLPDSSIICDYLEHNIPSRRSIRRSRSNAPERSGTKSMRTP